jgi:hypothetical protein
MVKERRPLIDKRKSFEKLHFNNNGSNISHYGFQTNEDSAKHSYRPKNERNRIVTPTRLEIRPSHNTDIFS